MADAVELQTAQDLAQIKVLIDQTKSKISLLNDAGEDTTSLRSTLRELEARYERWVKALAIRGVSIPTV